MSRNEPRTIAEAQEALEEIAQLVEADLKKDNLGSDAIEVCRAGLKFARSQMELYEDTETRDDSAIANITDYNRCLGMGKDFISMYASLLKKEKKDAVDEERAALLERTLRLIADQSLPFVPSGSNTHN